MRECDGGEGFVGDGGYLVLWRLGELGPNNQAYGCAEFAPGLLLFGTDGGGEGYAFDLRDDPPTYVMVPLVGLSVDAAQNCATSFTEFLVYLSSTR